MDDNNTQTTIMPYPGFSAAGSGETLAYVPITVLEDGCTVSRLTFANEPDPINWEVTDSSGVVVLQRNAAYETQYRFFGTGPFTIALQGWDGEKYVKISRSTPIYCTGP
jgi:hypothetical protein